MAERLTPRSTALFAAALALAAGAVVVRPGLAQSPPSLSSQTQEQADAKSAGCMYLRDGKLFTVTDAPPERPVGGAATENRGAGPAPAGRER